jgi:hypothetical protein
VFYFLSQGFSFIHTIHSYLPTDHRPAYHTLIALSGQHLGKKILVLFVLFLLKAVEEVQKRRGQVGNLNMYEVTFLPN